MLPVDDTGSLATNVYLVKVRGSNVEGPESCCHRIYAPTPAATTLTTASRSPSRDFGGGAEEADEAWRLQGREKGCTLGAKGKRNGCKPWPAIRRFMRPLDGSITLVSNS